MILIPASALILPGLAAFALGRVYRSHWPGVILALLALGSGVLFLSQASGAGWNDSAAYNQIFAAFGISLPAMISAAVGASFAHRMRAR